MEFGKFGSIDAKSFGRRLFAWTLVIKKCGLQEINKFVKDDNPFGLVLGEVSDLATLFDE
jgi:hypothetical protein